MIKWLNDSIFLHSRQKRSWIVEVTRLSLRPLIQARSVYDNLPIGRQFDFRAVHGARSRSLEVDSFVVVSAAVAGALEFVFARLPIRSAAQVRAACVNHEQTIGRAVDPDAEFLLELSVDAESELRGISNFEDSRNGRMPGTMRSESR
jgi:hypothetical protein